MTDALGIALSGLRAQGQRLGATASNIANASTTGTAPSQDAPAPASSVYRPLNVSLTALGTGGVRAEVREDPEGYTLIFDPTHPDANDDGLIAAPNVDLGREAVNLLEIKTLYKANLAVIRTQDELNESLLDTLA